MFSQESPVTSSLLAPFEKESPFIGSSLAFKGHLSQSRDAVIHPSTYSSFTLLRHSQTHTWHRCLGHKFFFINGDKPVYRAPVMQLGRCPFIESPAFSPIRRDSTSSMYRRPSAKPPHPSFFGIAKRRTSSR